MHEVRPGLSKSLFIRGLQCPKSLYLHKYAPAHRDPMAASYQRVLESGVTVGIHAQRLFPGGVEVPYDGLSPEEQIARTRELIDGGQGTIYEAAFGYDGVFVKADILHRRDGHREHGGWELYEVKGATKVKDHYPDDVAVQLYVVEGAGLRVSSASLVHVNNRYERSGPVDPAGLFTVVDLTEVVRGRQGRVGAVIASLRETLRGEEPVIPIGLQCDDPYPCDFKGYCWADVPAHSVFDLSGRRKKKFDLYREGFVRLEDVPPDRLNETPQRELRAFRAREDQIDPGAVGAFLATLRYPLYFLDFETCFDAIPPYDGVRPYEQIPYQYSLHVQAGPGSEPDHREFLAAAGADPRKGLLCHLLADIPAGVCVLAYNRTFEQRVLRSLARWFPDEADRLQGIIDGMLDLADPFRRKDVLLWRTMGSWSIKKVLPALVPDLGYEGMAIAGGDAAMDAWFTMSRADDDEEVRRIRQELLAYCRLDTLAMVRIVDRLREC